MQSVPAIGETLGDRYYIEEILDESDIIATLKCFDTRLDVNGVVKILLGDDTAPEWQARKDRFVAAARAQARLNHPNIVHVANIELRGGRVFSVLELLTGQTLDEYLLSGTLSSKAVVEAFLSVIDAVSMAHSSDILHLGISPRTIFLNQQGNRLSPRLLNFSVIRDSWALDPHSQLPFLAPEQLISYDNATPASDVYSICATMFYAFTHKLPVHFDRFEEYVDYFCSHDGISEFPEEVPDEFLHLLHIGLRVDPGQRFPDAGYLLKGLKEIGSGFKLSANLTIEASKNAAPAVTPSRPVVVNQPVATTTPSRPVVMNQPVATTTPSRPVVMNQPVATTTPSRPVVMNQPVATTTPSRPVVMSEPSRVSSASSSSLPPVTACKSSSSSIAPAPIAPAPIRAHEAVSQEPTAAAGSIIPFAKRAAGETTAQIAVKPVSSSVSQSLIVPECLRENVLDVPEPISNVDAALFEPQESVEPLKVSVSEIFQIPLALSLSDGAAETQGNAGDGIQKDVAGIEEAEQVFTEEAGNNTEMPAAEADIQVPEDPLADQVRMYGISLTEELSEIYTLRRIDCVQENSFIGAVSSLGCPDELFGLKCFYPRDEVEAVVFNEGVRRADILSRESSSFESIFASYPESCAFLMPDIARQPLPMALEANGGPFDVSLALHMTIIICQAMDFAQQRGFVNGNIKPSNIIFEEHNGVLAPVIYDFGQRLYVSSVSQISVQDIPYVAPELNYNLQNANSQADIFAVGMCLVYMLLGRMPYQSTNGDVLVSEIASYQGIPDIRSMNPLISDSLYQVIQWATAFNPAQRYVRFSDLIRDLYAVYQQIVSSNG